MGVVDFTYDDVGNRLTKVENSQTESYTYVTGTNRLQEVTGPVAYTYDANGNITGIGSKVLVYSQNNRLIRVEENSNILGEYTYNGLGQRVVKNADGVSTVFHYDFNGNIIAESDLNGNFTVEYLYRGKGRLAMVDVSSGAIYYYLNDRLGTPQMLTDATNTVVWEGVYKPFGEADVNPNSSVVNNFRFAGQYFDEETGLHYNWHRYYDPSTGRYLRPDPIGLISGINLFVYSRNNPINITDQYGLFLAADPFGTPPSLSPLLPDAYGISVSGSWINPVTGDRGGGDVVGLNRMYFVDDSQWYDYGFDSMCSDDPGAGLDVGISAEGVFAWGSGRWSGQFTSINVSLFSVSASIFWSPNFGWAGVTVGVNLSPIPAGVAIERTTYFPLQDREAFVP